MTDDVEQGHALALVPLAKEVMAYVRGRVPEGTDFAVLLMPAGRDDEGLGRIVAMSTDRHRMAFYAAQWALSVRNSPKEQDHD